MFYEIVTNNVTEYIALMCKSADLHIKYISNLIHIKLY